MIDSILDFLHNGLTGFSIGAMFITALIAVQFTIFCVTLFLHRCQAHRGIEFHPVLAHIVRFWLWIATGMITKEWVAIHRKHHATCETKEDPHSPKIYGIRKILLEGSELYRKAAKDQELLERYGHGTPDDWIERHVYTKHRILGVILMMFASVAAFGVLGLTFWAFMMIWIPFWAAGMINGTAHYVGYRNFETPDTSTNLYPLAIWIGGEELHNNHHSFPSSAKFSIKWWEFDIGWLYIRVLGFFGLVKVKKVAPKVYIDAGKESIDMETIKAIVVNRVNVMADYARQVITPMVKKSWREMPSAANFSVRKVKSLLVREHSMMDPSAEKALNVVLSDNQSLKTIYNFRIQLQQIWDRAAASHETLVQALKDWCVQAEATGIKALQDFARSLHGYTRAIPTSV